MAPKKKAARKVSTRSTKKAQPAAAPDQTRTEPLATLVAITPQNRKRAGYREVDVLAQADGVVGDKQRKKGDFFRIGVIGAGLLPPSVRAA